MAQLHTIIAIGISLRSDNQNKLWRSQRRHAECISSSRCYHEEDELQQPTNPAKAQPTHFPVASSSPLHFWLDS